MSRARAAARPAVPTEQAAARTLRTVVRKALNQPRLKPYEREDLIVPALKQALATTGHCYRTTDGRALFFRSRDRRFYEITDRPDRGEFGSLITYLAQISLLDGTMKRCVDRLRADVLQDADTVEIHGLAYDSPDLGIVAVNDFGGGMWHRKRGGAWVWLPNGTDGIFFSTFGPPVEPWQPEFSPDPSHRGGDHLDWFVEQPHFAEDALTVHDQRMLLRALLLVPFFPALCRNRPVPAHLGLSEKRQHDTGKTTAGKMMGLLLVGPGFEPTPPPESSERGVEALQLELMHKPFVLLDNVDTDIKWLNDFLCTYATGAAPTKRRLYTDTEQVTVPYRGRLVITSRKPAFKRSDTASRTIPFRFAPIRPEERKTERALLNPVLARRGKIWAGLLTAIAQVQDAFPTLEPPSPTLRLADFEEFGWRVAAVRGDADKWRAMVPRLGLAQAGFALQDEALVPVLRRLLADGDVEEQRTSEFYKTMQRVARELDMDLAVPFDAAACTKRIHDLEDALEAVLDVTIVTRTLSGYTLIRIVRGPSWGPR